MSRHQAGRFAEPTASMGLPQWLPRLHLCAIGVLAVTLCGQALAQTFGRPELAAPAPVEWLAATALDPALAPRERDEDMLAGPSLGQRISRYVALETSHLAIGMSPLSAAAIALPGGPGFSSAAQGPSALSGLAILPAGDFSVYARFGLTTPLADPATLAGQTSFAAPVADTLGEELLWGVGIGYQITDRWTGRFDFQQVPVLLSPGLGLSPTTSRYDLLSIGLTYDF